ncbi:Short-chain dehydrogenase [Bradyrhizobium erythrophlei]|nr:Short-chain dehydrogenase [Bradyrhizobium erythrophlei]
MNARKIKGAVALVTGANRGIGRALTEALLSRGVGKVYATARNPEALRELRDERLVLLQLDVTDADQISAAADAASDVDLVFNNAGVAFMGGIAESIVIGQARREMEVNYFGPLQLLQCLAPTLARNGGGAVVNIGSAAGLTNLPFVPTYSASKAALHSLTQAARILLGAQGTSVFGVYAGPVDTDMSRELAMPKTSPRDVAARDSRRDRGRAGIHLPGSVCGGFRPTVRVLAEGLGTAGRRDGGWPGGVNERRVA